MKLFRLLGILVAFGVAARANDSSFEGVGGSLRPMSGENKAIRMVRETVILSTGKDDFSTRAEFVFENQSARSQNVSMGFPEGNFGDVASDGPMKTSGFRAFKTSVDGRRVAAKRVHLKETDAQGFETYWIKTVPFAPRQTRRVRVEFRSPYGGTTNWGMTRALSYAFTGQNWRGNVGESVLEVRVTQPGLWRAVAFGENDKILPFSLVKDARGATFRRVWRNWNAEEGVIFGLERAVSFWRKDATNVDTGSLTMKTVLATQTVRVGIKPKTPETVSGFPADGFTREGVLYVGLHHLQSTLESWGEEPAKFAVKLGFSPTDQFDLRAGTLRLQGREGAKSVQLNGKSLALGAPVVGIFDGETRLIYLPLGPIARSLGWKVALRGERLFSLERANWRG